MPPGDVGPSTGQTTAAIAPAPFGLGRMEDWRVFPIKTTQKIKRNEEADIALHFQKKGGCEFVLLLRMGACPQRNRRNCQFMKDTLGPSSIFYSVKHMKAGAFHQLSPILLKLEASIRSCGKGIVSDESQRSNTLGSTQVNPNRLRHTFVKKSTC